VGNEKDNSNTILNKIFNLTEPVAEYIEHSFKIFVV
jgi:hypothetical protein